MRYLLKNISIEIEDLLKLVGNDKYEMTYYRLGSLDEIQKTLEILPELNHGCNIQFNLGESSEIIKAFYNKKIKAISISCKEYYIRYEIEKVFDFLIKIKNGSIDLAIQDSTDKINKLRELGADFGFKDKEHIRRIMTTFYTNSMINNYVENWQCILQDYTTIKSGNSFSPKLIDGQRVYVIDNLNLSLREPKQILIFKQIEQFVLPVFQLFNNSTVCTLNTKYIEEIKNLAIISGSEYIFNSSLKTNINVKVIDQLLKDDCIISYRSESYDENKLTYLRSLELEKKNNGVNIYLTFDNDVQQKLFERKTFNEYRLIEQEE